MSQLIEQYMNEVKYAGGVNTNLPAVFGGSVTFNGSRISNKVAITQLTGVAINATATLTAAQVLTGYITTTSASAVTMTMPTGTLLGGAIANCGQGTYFDFTVDNTAGANTVTMAVGTNGVQSDWDNQITTATASVTPAAITPLTIASGVSGIGVYRVTFSSATAYVFSRTA